MTAKRKNRPKSKPKPPPVVTTPAELAKSLGGFTPRSIRWWCERGLPGASKNDRGWWRIENPERAKAWLIDRGPKIATRQPIKIKAKGNGQPPPAWVEYDESSATAMDTAGQLVEITTRLGRIVDSMAESMSEKGEVSPGQATAFKALSSEHRELRRLDRAEREADGLLISRDRAEAIIVGWAEIDLRESANLPQSLPDRIVDSLASAGVEYPDQKLVLRLITEASREELDELNRRKVKALNDARSALDKVR